jgi:hypothetical protein
MRIKSTLFLLIALQSLSGRGQNQIQGFIFDKQNNKPLSYAIVSETHQRYGSYSDTTGLFTIFFQNENDSLKISSLGYNSKCFSVRDLQKSPKIMLESEPVLLGNITINPSRIKPNELEIGFFTKKTNIVSASAYPLNLQAVFIPSPKEGERLLIKSINFVYETTIQNSPLRIRLLDAEQNGQPGKDLIMQNLIIRKLKNGKKQVAEIDISKANLYMPKNGLFIVFEWIMDKSLARTNIKEGIPGPYIGGVKSNSESSHWISSLNSSKWIKIQSKTAFSAGLTVVNYSK